VSTAAQRYPNLSSYYSGASRGRGASPRYSAGGCATLVQETIPIVVDEWTYDFGRNRFVQLVVFEQGVLQTVSTLGYSHKD
jgi:hypothetical protein